MKKVFCFCHGSVVLLRRKSFVFRLPRKNYCSQRKEKEGVRQKKKGKEKKGGKQELLGGQKRSSFLQFCLAMSSWFTSSEDGASRRISDFPGVTLHPLPVTNNHNSGRATSSPEFSHAEIDPSDPMDDPMDESLWDDDYTEAMADESLWYEDPDFVAAALSLSGAIVLLLVVVLALRYRRR